VANCGGSALQSTACLDPSLSSNCSRHPRTFGTLAPAGIIAIQVLFAVDAVGSPPTGRPNPNEFMEEQW